MTNPVKAEALGRSVSFEYDGVTYTIPPASKWDIEVLEAMEDQKIITATRALLGAEQWATFKSKPRTVEDVTGLFEAANKAITGGQGN